MAFKKSASRYKQKTEIFLAAKPPTWLKLYSCFWFLWQVKEGIKANSQISLYELDSSLLQLFSCKKVSEIAIKSFTPQCFFP